MLLIEPFVYEYILDYEWSDEWWVYYIIDFSMMYVCECVFFSFFWVGKMLHLQL